MVIEILGMSSVSDLHSSKLSSFKRYTNIDKTKKGECQSRANSAYLKIYLNNNMYDNMSNYTEPATHVRMVIVCV